MMDFVHKHGRRSCCSTGVADRRLHSLERGQGTMRLMDTDDTPLSIHLTIGHLPV